MYSSFKKGTQVGPDKGNNLKLIRHMYSHTWPNPEKVRSAIGDGMETAPALCDLTRQTENMNITRMKKPTNSGNDAQSRQFVGHKWLSKAFTNHSCAQTL